MRLISAGLILLGSAAAPALAQQPSPASGMQAPEIRPGPADETKLQIASRNLIPFMRGEIAAAEYLSESFTRAVPPEQLRGLIAGYIRIHGQPTGITQIRQVNSNGGIYQLEFERSMARIAMTVDPADGRIFGLFFSNFQKRGDSLAAVKSEFEALPGKAGFAIAELRAGDLPDITTAYQAEEQFAVASTFKLYILAELGARIKSGKLRWDEVVPLKYRSYSSLATRGWPKNTPVTINTLALQMIAVSDNSASDTLLHRLGRKSVGKRVLQIGHANPAPTLPILSTVEALVLKGDDILRRKYLALDDAAQQRFLAANADKFRYDDVDRYVFSTPEPKHIGTIEWFASPTDTVQLLDQLKRDGSPRVLQIMSANLGTADGRQSKWRYLGYKGGSEPGVISMSFLAQSKSGKWFAITGSWNKADGVVDDARLGSLMNRLLDLTAKQ